MWPEYAQEKAEVQFNVSGNPGPAILAHDWAAAPAARAETDGKWLDFRDLVSGVVRRSPKEAFPVG